MDIKEKHNQRKRREYHKRKSEKCLNCEIITTNKFCTQKCQSIFREKQIFHKLEERKIDFTSNQTACRWYKRYLIFKFGEKCMDCGWDKKHPITQKVPIELEHIDGNAENNDLKNLKLLCPNCHSLTLTYKALNTGKGRFSRRKRYQEGKSF